MSDDKFEQLEKLSQLKEKGILSGKEFEEAKKNLLHGDSQSITPQIIIQNSTSSAATAIIGDNKKEKRYSVFIAFFLCLFGGWFGAHKFYTREFFSGILYMLTCGIFFLGWAWDLISIFFGFYRDGNGNALV